MYVLALNSQIPEVTLGYYMHRGCESAPWVILVINVNILVVGVIVLPSIFQISSTVEWQGQEDVETLQNDKDKYWQKLKTLHFYLSDPRSH